MVGQRLFKILFAVAVATLLAGCTSPAFPSVDEIRNYSKDESAAHVIVATMDTGINPYAPIFRASGLVEPRIFIPDLPPYKTISLSFDVPYAQAIVQDGLTRLERHQLYWFK